MNELKPIKKVGEFCSKYVFFTDHYGMLNRVGSLGQCMDFCRGRRGNRGGLCELRGISCSCFRSMAPVIVVVFRNDI